MEFDWWVGSGSELLHLHSLKKGDKVVAVIELFQFGFAYFYLFLYCDGK